MPTFVLPSLKEERHDPPVAPEPHSISAWERRIQIPVNTEILEAVRVDDAAEIVLRGTIKELRAASQQATGMESVNSNFLTVEITEVVCHTDDQGHYLEDVERGYRNGRGRG